MNKETALIKAKEAKARYLKAESEAVKCYGKEEYEAWAQAAEAWYNAMEAWKEVAKSFE